MEKKQMERVSTKLIEAKIAIKICAIEHIRDCESTSY